MKKFDPVLKQRKLTQRRFESKEQFWWRFLFLDETHPSP